MIKFFIAKGGRQDLFCDVFVTYKTLRIVCCRFCRLLAVCVPIVQQHRLVPVIQKLLD